MKAKQRKEAVQVFELDKGEVNECFLTYLKSKGAIVRERAQLTFDVKMGAMNREIESIKIGTKCVEENEGLSGWSNESEAEKPVQRIVALVKS